MAKNFERNKLPKLCKNYLYKPDSKLDKEIRSKNYRQIFFIDADARILRNIPANWIHQIVMMMVMIMCLKQEDFIQGMQGLCDI